MNYLGEVMAGHRSYRMDAGIRLKLYHSPDRANYREHLELVKEAVSDF
jgi:hypothetical protein